MNSNDKIQRLCDSNKSLRKELVKSLDQPKRLLEHVYKSLALKGKQFEIFQAASNEKNYVYKEVLLLKFDDNILSLSLRNFIRNFMNFTTNIVLVEHTIFTFLNVQMLIALGMNP